MSYGGATTLQINEALWLMRGEKNRDGLSF